MDLNETVGDRERLARVALAVGLAIVAIRSLRSGKRFRGVLAGVGALALGYTATNGTGDLTETLGMGESREEGQLRCAICSQPIEPGQRRGPNADGEIVHEACRVPAE